MTAYWLAIRAAIRAGVDGSEEGRLGLFITLLFSRHRHKAVMLHEIKIRFEREADLECRRTARHALLLNTDLPKAA